MEKVLNKEETGVVDFKAILGEVISENMTAEKIKPIIEKSLTKTVETVIEEQFRWNGKARKAIDEQVSEAMNCDIQMGLPSYNEQIASSLKDLIDSYFEEEGRKKLQSRLDELLQIPPKEIKLSEIVEKFKEEVIQYSTDDEGEFTCNIKQSYDWSEDYFQIELDKEPYKRGYDCEIKFSVDKSNGKVSHVGCARIQRNNDGAAGIYIDKYLSGVEKLIFHLYVGGSKLIIDVGEDDIDTSYSKHEDD